jgi:hypothetical protein
MRADHCKMRADYCTNLTNLVKAEDINHRSSSGCRLGGPRVIPTQSATEGIAPRIVAHASGWSDRRRWYAVRNSRVNRSILIDQRKRFFSAIECDDRNGNATARDRFEAALGFTIC